MPLFPAPSPWKATYTPGAWIVLAGARAVVLMPPAPPRAAQLIHDLWGDIIGAESVDALAGTLAAFRIEALPDFIAVFLGTDGIRALVRGSLVIRDGEGNVLADARGANTWAEIALAGHPLLVLEPETPDPDLPEEIALPLVLGAVQAGRVLLDVETKVAFPVGEAQPVAGISMPVVPIVMPSQAESNEADVQPSEEPDDTFQRANDEQAVPQSEFELRPEPAAQEEHDEISFVGGPINDLIGDEPKTSAAPLVPGPFGPVSTSGHPSVSSQSFGAPMLPQPQPTPPPAGPLPPSPFGQSNPDQFGQQIYGQQLSPLGAPQPQPPFGQQTPLPLGQSPFGNQTLPPPPSAQPFSTPQPGQPPQALGASPDGAARFQPEPAAGVAPQYIEGTPWRMSPAGTEQEPQASHDDVHDGETIFVTSLANTHKPSGPTSPDNLVLACLCPMQHANQPGVPTCVSCGMPVDTLSLRLVNRPVIAIVQASSGETAELSSSMYIGRAPTVPPTETHAAILAVPSPRQDISRTHCKLEVRDWVIYVTDELSTNGTQIQDRPDSEPRRLNPGEPTPLQIGSLIDLGDGVVITLGSPR